MLVLAGATSVFGGGQDASGPALQPPLERPALVPGGPPAQGPAPVPSPGRPLTNPVAVPDASRLRPSTSLIRPRLAMPAPGSTPTVTTAPVAPPTPATTAGLAEPALAPPTAVEPDSLAPEATSLETPTLRVPELDGPAPPRTPAPAVGLLPPPLEGPGPFSNPSIGVQLAPPELPPALEPAPSAVPAGTGGGGGGGFALPRFEGPRLPIEGLEPPRVDLAPSTTTPDPDAPPSLEGPRTLTLETLPDEPLPGLPDLGLDPDDRRDRKSDREKSLAEELEDDRPFEPDPPPRRRGLFGLPLPRPFAGPAPSRAVPPPAKPVSKADPASEDALRRRIESQVREVAGRHLRSVDVRVRGERVRIRLDVDRFWNKRTVRRSVETLPILAGYDVDIDIDD